MMGNHTRVPATSSRRRLTERLLSFWARDSSATALAGLGFGLGRALALGRLEGRPGSSFARAPGGRPGLAGRGLCSRRRLGFGLALRRFAVPRLGIGGRGGSARLGIRAFAVAG